MKPTVHTFERMYRLAITFTIIVLLGCGSGSNSADSEPIDRSATISFQLNFNQPSNHALNIPVNHAIGEPDICNDYLIEKIHVQVFRNRDDSEAASVEADCAEHSLTISKVPAAKTLYLVCKGYVGSNPVWQGRVDGIVAVAGQNTELGVIDMNYSGDDGAAPEVVSTFPEPDAANVDLNASIVVVFNETLAPGSISGQAIAVLHDDIPVSGQVSYDPAFNSIHFLPTDAFDTETTYTVTLQSQSDGSGTISDTAGHHFSDDVNWKFTTRGIEDDAAPQVIVTLPRDGATDVAPQDTISAIFSEPMDPDSLTGTVFQISSDQGTVSGKIAYDVQTRTLSMTPDSALNAATLYTAVISTQAQDLAQNSLSETYTWQFLTIGYTISTSVTPENGYGGLISPANATVMYGDDISINIKVNPYYHLSELIVDGIPVVPVSSYLFENVTGNHKIEAIIESNAVNISKKWSIYHYDPKSNTNGDVVWYGCYDLGGDCDIFYYDGSTTKNITEEKELDGAHSYPQINDNGDVVWSGREDENSDYAIYYYNRSTTSIITISESQGGNPEGNDYSPQINANGDVVWYGFEGTSSDKAIYYYNRSTAATTIISEGPDGNPNGDDLYPRINADGDVVWQGQKNRTGLSSDTDYDIYYYDREKEADPVTIISKNPDGDDEMPQINDNGNVVWANRLINDQLVGIYLSFP